jgi:ribonuclease HII
MMSKRKEKKELKLYSQTDKLEAGIDEVGRGCLFGRVYTALVSLPIGFDEEEKTKKMVKDSKKLTPKQREEAYDYIMDNAVDVQVDYMEVPAIDRLNILWASVKSMNNCIRKSPLTYGKVLIDGDKFKYFYDDIEKTTQHECVVKGDATYYSIASASIIAKVSRDRWIFDICEQFPELDQKYDLKNNLGYDRPPHRKGIREYGISEFHRKTFGICKEYAEKGLGYNDCVF